MPANRLNMGLTGIERFPSLKSLHLYQCRKLNRLDALANAQSIQTIRLSHCSALNDLSAIAQLHELRVLEIESCHTISSVAPLAQCKKLQRLQIAGDTVVADGDFSLLRKLEELKEVLLANKKHYSHTAEELQRN